MTNALIKQRIRNQKNASGAITQRRPAALPAAAKNEPAHVDGGGRKKEAQIRAKGEAETERERDR